MNAPKAIPTIYGGTRFRSRLEATWAAFFDLLRWRWAYEPTDLNGYIPDFDVVFGKRPLLVEIKPTQDSFDAAKSKLECSGWDGDAAILVSAETKTCGVMFDGEVWDTAVIAFCMACERATIIQEAGAWRCRNCDASSRDLWFAYDPAPLWAQAKNTTQWRAA
jgi:hypothetical protein